MSDGAAATWVGTSAILGLAMLSAMWRVGYLLSGLRSDVQSLAARLDHIQAHQDAHDAWHMSRLTNGKDSR